MFSLLGGLTESYIDHGAQSVNPQELVIKKIYDLISLFAVAKSEQGLVVC